MSLSGSLPCKFDDRDRFQLREHGLDENRALAQLATFRAGRKHARLDRPCTLNDGIVRLADTDSDSLSAGFSAATAAGRAQVFVPASGAATRMFKGPNTLLHRTPRPDLAGLAAAAGQDADAKDTLEWFMRLRDFPFFRELSAAAARAGGDAEALMAAGDYGRLLEAMLAPAGLRYAELPKALIPFHSEGGAIRNPLDEHVADAVGLVRDREGLCRLHFTVSPEHEAAVQAALARARKPFEAEGVRFLINLSFQKPSTDTLAADSENRPFRDTEGRLVFRPGGHGTLLENLQHTGGDLVFVRNIDNVAPARLRNSLLARRRALGGYLTYLQDRIFAYRGELARSPHARLAEEAARFAAQCFGLVAPESLRVPPADAQSLKAKCAWLAHAFARPLRVCAMVKNAGEPGGGPFWVRYSDGSVRPQIVEASQVDTSQADQRRILESATHFNPVDMVLALRDADGSAYPLQDFVDGEACLISEKSKDGKPLKALEVPGLWNGSMAFWNTAFVEAPLETFNPVKTVNDLLRENHRE